ncbi:MAG: RAMP superfamily CRISPR-associated protein [Limnospira sp. PMC 1291.21]|uniref:RAMP superfamily CRISPR-associated protein n=1 Tax=unclassified Limnospira TaxID=2642885 RepID=UPI0028E0C568|nr:MULTISPECIES: RAMP superfamily CRISPR-associated protein [unclassified Limnospira]MDT9176087.1 RAMP superfamily CRISPR-associated protein [Limnospira sp. PMC 1238.20]MDT9222012.1 RAMP superfamily CRISPR-associated protein [Limnospira sp. PMC 1279.21]MDT9227118.1 RAMP superfamily CRISPR-associated protein [Limnospira sp. PMC 1242.20]MDT9237428.1 RAMP superfamily CRISPR-associated protein [Limnospira sp. PMC 1261.20]MDT9247655.1 RAMP superfamily CRISPR-associated protein [Limnospira sp. PMC 1
MAPPNRRPDNASQVSKPYEFVEFPPNAPTLTSPAGHHKYLKNRIHGILHLQLTVETALHISTGTVMMGRDLGQSKIPLIKTMQTGNEKLTIPGSSLKGVVRSIYEALTVSCVCKIKTQGYQKTKQDGKLRYSLNIPRGYKECKPKKNEIQKRSVKLCPACRIFGALGFQGLLEFADAKASNIQSQTGCMPSLHEPQRNCEEYYVNNRNQISQGQLNGNLKGRKFYYQTENVASSNQQKGIPVQQANRQYVFENKLPFKNLTLAELGALLASLGQDQDYPFSLKVGAGKPIGMGTMTVKITQIQRTESMRDRYSDYNTEPPSLTGSELQTFIKQAIAAAHQQKLLELPQLKQLQKILAYPTNREARAEY